ncbi:MAG: hypothetical protein J1F12_05835 [Muribaculaceae bacterium]|nr:hypothetical protein [Muribaculaceae bacterium]
MTIRKNTQSNECRDNYKKNMEGIIEDNYIRNIKEIEYQPSAYYKVYAL